MNLDFNEKKEKRRKTRKRNFIAKQLREDKAFRIKRVESQTKYKRKFKNNKEFEQEYDIDE